MVPSKMIEQEFWRIVSTPEDEVTVEYGNRIRTKTHGSGFPVTSSPNDPLVRYFTIPLNQLFPLIC